MKLFSHLSIILLFTSAISAEVDRWLDELGDNLVFSSATGSLRASLSGSLNLEHYVFEDPTPALLRSDDNSLSQARLILYLDTQLGDQLYAFAQARFDRGFDPSDGSYRDRLDEYALRFTPWSDGRINFQAGQFSTIVGKWVSRHDPADNPFISAPLPYEQTTQISDIGIARSPDYFSEPFFEERYSYNPIIWGPAYSSGFAVSGKANTLEWAFELKNNALLSRPSVWPINRTDFSDPTWGARLGWRPSLQWEFGLSASEGTYLAEDEFIEGWRGTAPRSNYRQAVYIFDLSYALHHLEIWGEIVHSRYRTPAFSGLHTTAAFIETRYRFSPTFSAALRINRQIFSDLKWGDYEQQNARWGETIDRLDVAGTWRLSAHTKLKIELNLRKGEIGLDGLGYGGAAQLSIAF